MKSINQKENVNIILIGILVFLLIGSGVYFGIMKKSKPAPQSSVEKAVNTEQQSSPSPTAGQTIIRTNLKSQYFGTIEGSLGYPSEGIPDDLEVCAEHIVREEKYCTLTHIKNDKYKYGVGYKINVPAGAYYVFAIRKGGDERAYYSKFVTCGLKADCPSHEPIKVIVKAKRVVKNVDPQDWYNNNAPYLIYKSDYFVYEKKYNTIGAKNCRTKVLAFKNIPILKIIIFDDQNENGIMDNSERYMGAIGLIIRSIDNDNKCWPISEKLTYRGVAKLNKLPLHQDMMISFPARNNKFYGHSGFTSSPTGYFNLYKITNTNQYKFRIDKIPHKTKIIYFGLKKIGKWRWEKEKSGNEYLKEYIEK